MGRSTKAVVDTAPTPGFEDLIGSLSSDKSRVSKHIGFTEIRFKNNRVECDYTVNGGNITSEGTFTVRYNKDDAIGLLAAKLAEELVSAYAKFERSH